MKHKRTYQTYDDALMVVANVIKACDRRGKRHRRIMIYRFAGGFQVSSKRVDHERAVPYQRNGRRMRMGGRWPVEGV